MAKHFRKGPVDLDPARKERLRKAYADPDIALHAIGRRFGISDNRLSAIAESEGWPLRRQAAQAAASREERVNG